MASVAQEVIAPTVSADELRALQSAVDRFDRDQLIWSSGFLAGLAGNSAPRIAEQVPLEAAAPVSWTVFYATETGNSRRVAEQVAERSRQAGIAVELQNLRDFRPRGLAKIDNAVFVLATHGIGEPADGTEEFFEHWFSDKAARLDQLNYSVLALGDSSYADFCEIGRRFDARLTELGANPVVSRVDCDLDFESEARRWSGNIVDHTQQTTVVTTVVPALRAVPSASVFNRDNPFNAEILTRQKITGNGSSKDVRHIELDLQGSDVHYTPGDSLGIVPQNPEPLIQALLGQLRFDAAAAVMVNGRELSLHQALLSEKEITVLNRPLLQTVAARHNSLASILSHRERFAEYIATRQLIDVVNEFPGNWQPQEFVDALRNLTPRLYSIASSPDANPDEAHLTVSVVDYEAFGRRHWGSASTYLASDSTHAPVYLQANDNFRLPQDDDTPVIMVGAGTGVAPYRAFVEHRREHGSKGDNWLIFGDRNLSTDFLYQLEWLRYRKQGWLANLDVAFSRDQADKHYVQHAIRKKSSELFGWLQRGAHFYVCGDALNMAPDVHRALIDAVAVGGGMTDELALEYVADLKQSRRYLRDVY